MDDWKVALLACLVCRSDRIDDGRQRQSQSEAPLTSACWSGARSKQRRRRLRRAFQKLKIRTVSRGDGTIRSARSMTSRASGSALRIISLLTSSRSCAAAAARRRFSSRVACNSILSFLMVDRHHL